MVYVIMSDKKKVITENDMFRFERTEFDIPFYNNNPPLSKVKWIVLGLSILIPLLMVFSKLPFILDGISYRSILFFLIPFLGFGFASDWKYNLIIKKFKKLDVVVIFVLTILMLSYSTFVVQIFGDFGLAPHPAMFLFGELDSIINVLLIPLQLVGEEFFRIILFIIVLLLSFKYLNRKYSIIIGTLVSSLVFGLIHVSIAAPVSFVLLNQGLGSAFLTYSYIKTKNILVSSAIHIIFDFTLIILTLITLPIN
jgi:CAAX protease family protein